MQKTHLGIVICFPVPDYLFPYGTVPGLFHSDTFIVRFVTRQGLRNLAGQGNHEKTLHGGLFALPGVSFLLFACFDLEEGRALTSLGASASRARGENDS